MAETKLRTLSAKFLRSDRGLAIFIFFFTLIIFLISRVHQVADSQYSMLVSQSLLQHRSFTLDNYALPHYEPVWHGYYSRLGPIYQLEVVDGHIYYHLPPGSAILSAPYVGLMNLAGVSAANPDGRYNPHGEVKIEASLAALLMALLAVIFFLTSRLLLSRGLSFALALSGALGTQIYSTASRALWSETWGVGLIGIVILLLLAHETKRRLLNPVLLATLLAWSYFVRPTFAIPIVAITIYLLVFHCRYFLSYAVTGVVWFLGFVFYSWFHFGHWLPSYYRASRLHTNTFWIAFAGNLISPGRGLLVYVPALLFVAYLLIRYRRYIRFPRLVWLSLGIIFAHLIVISSFPHWWGGHSFGPRFTTGLVPWFVLLAVLGLDAMREAVRLAKMRLASQRLQLATGLVLVVVSAFINTVGATQPATWLWNGRPRDIDRSPERLWDWRQPQFLAKYLPYPPPAEFPELTDERIDFSKPESSGYLWYGWTEADAGAVWADTDAAMVFSLANQEPANLRLSLSPFLVPGKLEVQRVNVKLNGQPLTEFTVRAAGPNVYTLQLPANLISAKNVLSFQMPDARAPQKMGISEDPRPRSFSLQWLEKEVSK